MRVGGGSDVPRGVIHRLNCGLEAKMRLALRLTSSRWCVCVCVWLSFTWDGPPLWYLLTISSMDKETKVGSAAEMHFLPTVLFLSLYRYARTHTHTRGTARGMCVVERLKAPIHFCVFGFQRRWWVLKWPRMKTNRKRVRFLFSVTPLVDKLLVLLWETGWKKPVSISRLQNFLIIQRETKEQSHRHQLTS